MTTLDVQIARASVGGQRASLSECSITLDRAWSPYVQGSAVLNGIHDIDPDAGTRFQVRFEQWFTLGRTDAEIAELWSGTASALASSFAPRTAAEIAELYQTPLNADTFPPTFLTADLLIRDVELDLAERVTRLTLASDDMRLWDAGLVSTSPLPFAATSLRAIVEIILGFLGVSLAAGDADAELEEPPVLNQGQTYRSFLTPLLQVAGLRLYADEQRVWHLVPAELNLPGGVTFSTARGVFGARPRVDRETGGYDSVVIEYRWTVEGEVLQAWDVAGPRRARKTFKQTFEETAYPGPGAAARILSRMVRRRRSVPIEAAANYAARPTMSASLSSPALPQQSGRISRVMFQWPGRTMNADLYDLESVNLESVKAIPPTYRTNELPGLVKNLKVGSL